MVVNSMPSGSGLHVPRQGRTRPIIIGGGGDNIGFSVHGSYDKNYVAIHTRICFTRPHALCKLQLDLNQYSGGEEAPLGWGVEN